MTVEPQLICPLHQPVSLVFFSDTFIDDAQAASASWDGSTLRRQATSILYAPQSVRSSIGLSSRGALSPSMHSIVGVQQQRRELQICAVILTPLVTAT
jgi:hypothetical protein